MATVTFVDETTAGQRGDAWHLEIFEERLPLREVIRRRIFQEVAEHNAGGGAVFRGLVQPATAKPRHVDPEKQFAKAVEAFSRNGFIVLVDDLQVEELDTMLDLRMGTEITFLKLVPLVGG
ncbi:MAG TPA: hypothetical protein VF062_14885 [Candidatus Limnocylindrales bacterium]